MTYTRIAAIVGLMLLIPLVLSNVKGSGWDWGPLDYVVMGMLLFLTGIAIDYAIRKLGVTPKGIVAVCLIVLALAAIWVELAVDGVSQLVAFLIGE